jgi:hypothetical protein
MEAPFHLQSASLPFPVNFKAKCSLSEICRQHVLLQGWKTPTYKMEHTMEQRVNGNVCVKLQKYPSETLQILKSVYGESRTIKKPWISKSKIKTMLIFFFNIWGIIHFEFALEGSTVNQTFYVEVLERLTDTVRNKRGEL